MKASTLLLLAGMGLLGWYVFKKARPTLPRPAADGNIYDYDTAQAENDNAKAMAQMEQLREDYGWPDADVSVLINAQDRR